MKAYKKEGNTSSFSSVHTLTTALFLDDSCYHRFSSQGQHLACLSGFAS